MVKMRSMGVLMLLVFFVWALEAPATETTGVDRLLEEAKASAKAVSPQEVKKMIDTKEKVVFLDVRDMQEYLQDHMPAAVNLPRTVNLSDRIFEHHLTRLAPDKNAKVVVYCMFVTRSPLAVKAMQEFGYKDAAYMTGGYKAWKEAGYPVEKQ